VEALLREEECSQWKRFVNQKAFEPGVKRWGKLQMTRVVNQERKNNMMEAETRK